MTDAIPSPRANPILIKFRAALAEMYGDQLERVVLYGSRARGDAQPDSDYDIAVFIKEPSTFTEDSERLAAISTDILFDSGAVISATPFPAGAYRDRTGFMNELRRDGLDL
jgi:uncharacterized protein